MRIILGGLIRGELSGNYFELRLREAPEQEMLLNAPLIVAFVFSYLVFFIYNPQFIQSKILKETWSCS